MPTLITLSAKENQINQNVETTTMSPVSKIISESVSNAPMNKNAHILIKEAKIKRPEILSPEITKPSGKGYGLWSKNPLFSRAVKLEVSVILFVDFSNRGFALQGWRKFSNNGVVLLLTQSPKGPSLENWS